MILRRFFSNVAAVCSNRRKWLRGMIRRDRQFLWGNNMLAGYAFAIVAKQADRGGACEGQTCGKRQQVARIEQQRNPGWAIGLHPESEVARIERKRNPGTAMRATKLNRKFRCAQLGPQLSTRQQH